MSTRNGNTRTIAEDKELVLALLIAETEDGGYEPVGPVATIREAREIAASDRAGRMRELKEGGEPMCPAGAVTFSV